MIPAEDREKVRTQLNVNWVVEAGAGTGKTTLLIERLCFALLAQGILASRLVALTFTEKAAAEIKMRLMIKLQQVIRAVQEQIADPVLDTLHIHFHVPDEVIVFRAEVALAQLDRSQIGTIHSFCADILRQYPLEAGLSPQADIDPGIRAQHISEACWNQFLDQELGPHAPQASEWKEILKHISLTQLYTCVQQLCSGKIEHFDYFAQKDKLIQICLQHAKQAQRLAETFLEGKKKPRTIERALQQAAARLEQAAQWLQNGTVSGLEEETISISSVPKDWDPASVDEAKALCYFAAQANPVVQKMILQVYKLLEPVVLQIRQQYQAQGILSFDDLIVKTRTLLQQNLLVRRLLQEQYDAFYIDEFQDTDPVQGELLLFLAEEKGNAASTWQTVKLAPGKLFVVGDPKQSIYRFRGADITAYELFTDLILKQGGKKAYLRQNFRSVPDIVALANEVCGKVMVEKTAFQPAYEPIFTQRPALPKSTEMVLVCSPEQKISADDYRHNQAQWVADWIARHVGKLTLQDGHKLAYQDIAILTRATTTLWPYTDALRRKGIAFSVEEDRNFYSKPELTDLLNLLRVLDNAKNKIALVGVLRSPLGALTDEEIYQMSQRDELDYNKPSQNKKAERLFVCLRTWADQAGRRPLYSWLQDLLQHTFFQEACAHAYDGVRSITQLGKWISWVQNYTFQVPVTLGQFLSRAEDLLQQESTRLSVNSDDESAQAVRIMTVHKSKGLEFPVVIWVDLSKKDIQTPAMRPNHLYSWRYDVHGLRVGKYADINLAWLEEEQREQARCEEIRVLYVALTRAKEKLILTGNVASESGTVADLFRKAGLFPTPERKPAQTGQEAHLHLQYAAYIAPETFIYQLPTTPQTAVMPMGWSAWQKAQTQRQRAYEQVQKPLAPSLQGQVMSSENTPATQLGSWIHAVLKRHVHYPKQSLSELLQATRRFGSPTLQSQAQQLLQNFWQSPAFEQITHMKLLGAELPFSLRTAQGIVNGIMDLLLQDEKGIIWVMDYKTDEVSVATAAQAALKYAAQLSVYVQAAQKIYPSATVKAAVVWIRTGQMIALSASEVGS